MEKGMAKEKVPYMNVIDGTLYTDIYEAMDCMLRSGRPVASWQIVFDEDTVRTMELWTAFGSTMFIWNDNGIYTPIKSGDVDENAEATHMSRPDELGEWVQV